MAQQTGNWEYVACSECMQYPAINGIKCVDLISIHNCFSAQGFFCAISFSDGGDGDSCCKSDPGQQAKAYSSGVGHANGGG